MESVLISIKPKWCKLIADGKKTVEVRKTKPKLGTPFKCYIYCTKGKPIFEQSAFCNDISNGKVIGEFVCDEIFPIRVFENGGIQDYMLHRIERSCVPYDDISNYIGKSKTGFGWHISDLIIYDKPMELNEFVSTSIVNTNCFGQHLHKLDKPPQSWCYAKYERSGK